MRFLRIALVLAQLPAALMILYLDLLTVAALRWRRAPAPVAPSRRFAILVPAHDEELLLPRLLESLAALAYPCDRYEVCVVADNCTDRTAALARVASGRVYERHDDQLRGKGYALRWLLEQLRADGCAYDAYVVIDADTVVSPNLLDAMAAYLERGDQVVQCYYGVRNRDAAWSATLRYAALALFNDLRPRGRDALGLSAGLRGNGMCFAAAVLDRFDWESFALAEDAEFHLRLVDAGLRVAYAPGAQVLAEMPTTLRQAHSQNVRWERGRLQMLRAWGPRLLATGLARRDATRLDAIAEQLTPPLSALTALVVAPLLVATALPARAARRLATALALGEVAYVLAGLRLVGAQPRAYLTLLLAPVYIAWKLGVYVVAALGLGDERWVRTARGDADNE